MYVHMILSSVKVAAVLERATHLVNRMFSMLYMCMSVCFGCFHLSRVIRKSDFCIYENKDADQLRS